MQYAERLPNSRTLLAPVLALALGAAAATGAYALTDNETVVVEDPQVIVAEVPAQGSTAGGKNEARIAAAIAAPASPGGADEAATAAAISPPESTPDNRLNAPGPRTN